MLCGASIGALAGELALGPLTLVSVGRAQPSRATVSVVNGFAVYVASGGAAAGDVHVLEGGTGTMRLEWWSVTLTGVVPEPGAAAVATAALLACWVGLRARRSRSG